MKAIVQDRYGSPDVLHATGGRRPGARRRRDVRVRVAAASVNAADWHVMRGDPELARLADRGTFGRVGPRQPIRGTRLRRPGRRGRC